MEQNSNILEPMKGIVEGTGTHFEVTDSEYLNITLDSNKEIKLRLESIPEMITINISKPTKEDLDFSTEITISGLNPNTTYHKYENHYYNHETFTTDEKGSYSYNLDISKTHLVFIQPRPSTYFLREAGWFDELNNPLPSSIATWDNSPGVRTATLEANITNQSIEIEVNNATLDGKGYTTTGSGTGYGIFLGNFIHAITIKNIQITNFSYGIIIIQGNTNIILNNISIFNNIHGIYLNYNISNSIIENNTIYNNFSGINLYYENLNNTVQNNNIYNHSYGIFSFINNSNNIIKNNNLHDNSLGVSFYRNNRFNTVDYNIIHDNYYAIYFYQYHNNENAIINNCIINNNYGINISLSNNNNNFEYNNFINSPNTNAYNTSSNNFNSNYWDDWIGSGPYFIFPIGQDNNPSPIPIYNIPITTNITLAGTLGDNDWFISDVEIELEAISSPCTADIDKTFYSFNGIDFIEYISTLVISDEGIHTIHYYSVDTNNNIEPTKTKEFKIDKTPPVININVPADGSECILNENIPSDWSASDNCSGVASATGTVDNGDPIDTSSLGEKDFLVSATNNAGLSSSMATKYNVIVLQRGIKLDEFLINKNFIFEKD